jgi:hypothetical protein
MSTFNCPHGTPWEYVCGPCDDERIAERAAEQLAAQAYGGKTRENPGKPSRGQVDGDHYKKLSVQPFAYSMANKLDPLQHTIIKYVTRFRDKAGVKDLRKAIHCTELLIAWEEGGLSAFDLQVKLDELQADEG